MKHELRLHNEPFEMIKKGIKKIEMRLFDEKRQLLKVGDFIEFENRKNQEKLLVKIVGLYRFESFEDLYKHFDKIILGYNKDEIVSPKDMEKYYSKEEQERYGVVGIEIELVNI